MRGRSRLFWTIVLALLGACAPERTASFGPVAVDRVTAAELIPIEEPLPVAPAAEVPEAVPTVAAAPVAAPRRAGWARRGAGYLFAKPAAPPAVEEAPTYAPILRGGPRWNGERLGVGRVRPR